MSWKGPRLWIGLCSLMAVLLIASVDMGRKSPGPLTEVHRREKDLAGRSGCADCHGGFLGSMRGACLECHEHIEGQMQAESGLHGRLDQAEIARCGTCHSEHHGARFAIVNQQTFARAGVPDPGQFDHGLVGFAMAGKHLELECSQCHTNAEVEVLAAGQFRYGGLVQDCASCHEDVHAGQMAVACADCHGQAAWDELFSLGHDRVLPLAGGHADLSCRECHAEGDFHALEIVGGAGARPTARACLDCHESPHADPFAGSAAEVLAQPLPASCGGCHLAEHETFRDERIPLDAPLHAGSGFALVEPHAEVTCDECHDPLLETFAERYPGRTGQACSVCHADPHEGQFATGPFSEGECTVCHAPHEWEPPAFGVAEHGRTELALTGAHVETDCHDCHMLSGESARVFRGMSSDCDACHLDAHRGFFDPLTEELARAEHGTCASCHSTTTFAELPQTGFDHLGFTEFPILGAHAQEDCEACHVPEPEPDVYGRSFGFVEDRFGEVEGCETCHVDVHRGAFDGQEMPRHADDRTGCARCHVEVSFRVFEGGFDHLLWTGFALESSHAEFGCTECHLPKDEPDEFGLTWGAAAGRACSDCHADPHGGQFLDAGRQNDCSRCHDETTFADLVFRHDWDSSFALGEAHEDVACSACHPLVPHGKGQIVRYKPLKSECVDCHGVHEGKLLRRKRSDQ